MSKHTPGPWKAPLISSFMGAANSTTGFVWAEEPHGGPVATICTSVANPDTARTANARLIAAAPDMLDALKSLQQPLLVAIDIAGQNTTEEEMLSKAYHDVQDAIAKAEGESTE